MCKRPPNHPCSHTQIGDLPVQLGDVVKLPTEDTADEEGGAGGAAAAAAAAGVLDTDVLLGNVVCLFEEDGEKMAQVCGCGGVVWSDVVGMESVGWYC